MRNLLSTWMILSTSLVASLAAVDDPAVLRVRAVPQVGTNPAIPHVSYEGVPTTLKAVVDGSAASGVYTLEWDLLGNGTYPVSVSRSGRFADYNHTYNGLAGDVTYQARVRVRATISGTEYTASATYPVKIFDNVNANDEVKADRAIDDGLWYLYRNLTWSGARANLNDQYGPNGATACAIQAFQNQGHFLFGNAATNPYVDGVQGMHRFLHTLISRQPISNQPAGNPDLDGNGTGIRLTYSNHWGYENNLILISLASSKAPTWTIAATDNAGLAGVTYQTVVGQMVEYLAFAQGDPGYAGRGSWHYNPNSTVADGSALQWATLGAMIAQDQMGASIPPFLISELQYTIDQLQNPTSGGFGYNYNTQWLNGAKTGGNLTTLLLAGDVPTSTRITKARQSIADNWNIPNADYRVVGSYYAMFSVMKGARSFSPHLETFTASNGTVINWYQQFRSFLLANRQADGRMNGDVWIFGNTGERITTAMGVEILQRVFLNAPPVAKATTVSASVPTNDVARVRHNESYHNDASHQLVLFEWDFNADGTYDFSTADANAVVTFPTGAAGTLHPVLRVTDDLGAIATDSVAIVVSGSNHAPVAVPGPATNPTYVAGLRQNRIELDGRGSYDPDAANGDSITGWGWDLDNDGVIDATGAQMTVSPLPAAWQAGNTYTITLRVTDDGGWDNDPATDHLTGVATATVQVVASINEPPVAVAQNLTVSTDPGLPTATVLPQQVDGGSSDPDGDPLNFSLFPAGPFPIGTTQVVFAISDMEFNVVANATITVIDTQAPAFLAIPQNIVVPTDAGRPDAVVTWPAPVVTDNSGQVAATCSPAPGSTFPLGVTTVTCTAVDGSGNQASVSFTVTVEDREAPIIAAHDNIVVGTDAGVNTAVVVFASPVATDNVGVTSLTCLPASGSTFPLGITTVTCTASDAAGNQATSTFTVTVEDREAPVIAAHDDIVVGTDAGVSTAVVAFADPAATDNVGVASLTCTPASGSTFPLGTTTVTCTATDAVGNTSTRTFTVTVEDREAPVVSCTLGTALLWSPNHQMVDVGLVLTNTDNVGIASMAMSVTQDEALYQTGSGRSGPDAEILRDAAGTITGLRLRAERAGGEDGRVYLIRVTVTDVTGLSTTAILTAVVPKSMSPADVAAVEAQATAARTAGTPLAVDSTSTSEAPKTPKGKG